MVARNHGTSPGPRRTEGEAWTSCRIAVPYLHRFVEGELETVRANAIREHLGICSGCRRRREELEAERLWLIESLTSQPELSERLTEKIVGRIRAERIGQRRKDRSRRPARGAPGARRRTLFGSGLAAVAAAASAVAAWLIIAALSSPTLAPPPSASRIARAPAPLGADAGAPTRAARAVSPAPVLGATPVHLTVRPGPVSVKRGPAQTPPAASVARDVERVRLNISDVVGLAARLTPEEGVGRSARKDQDPCTPDPNKDGITDIKDFAYACQVLMGGPLLMDGQVISDDVVYSRHQGGETSLTDADCDEYCLRA